MSLKCIPWTLFSLLSGLCSPTSQISNGSLIEINETGTRMRLVPGLLVGGSHLEHECHASRSIGYYLEALASLAPFAKHATEITLRGVTNDDRDPSVQYARWLPATAALLFADSLEKSGQKTLNFR